jgi:protein O-GlcNAc transferase
MTRRHSDQKIVMEHTRHAMALHQAGRLDEAEALYKHALRANPRQFEALHFLGVLEAQRGRYEEADRLISRSLKENRLSAEAHANLAGVLSVLKRSREAVASSDRALKLNPRLGEAFVNKGNALQDLGEYEQALANYDKALAINPNDITALSYRGKALGTLGRFQEALETCRKALAIRPDFILALMACGMALEALHRSEEAIAIYRRALAIQSDFADAHHALAGLLLEEGTLTEATSHYQRALAAKPNDAEIRFALCMAQLPILYMQQAEIVDRRATYESHLRALSADIEKKLITGDLPGAVGSKQPFYLPYQGHNDRELQHLYGASVCRIMADRYPPAILSRLPRPDEPLRVGIVSGFFRSHSVWKAPVKGWLTQLDRLRFQFFGYYTGGRQDAETKAAAALCERFVQGPLSLDRWRETILTDALHVLIYPEVGMDTVPAQLAAQRLAPVQCNSWGHPTTSGFPTLDYYISSDLMEPSGAQEHYTEHLIRLPNLSVYYEAPQVSSVALARPELGLRRTGTAFWCGQSLFKYLPQFDQVFPRIALETPDCQFVFLAYNRGKRITDLFKERLTEAFAAYGLNFSDHCIVLPRFDTDRFIAAIGACDVVLDSIGWSGFNSTLEGLIHDLPIVTMAGPMMRGRHGSAILGMLGVSDTTAASTDEYVSIAARLARDIPWRREIMSQIAVNKHRLYRDSTCISALAEFLDRAARTQGAEQGTEGS